MRTMARVSSYVYFRLSSLIVSGRSFENMKSVEATLMRWAMQLAKVALWVESSRK